MKKLALLILLAVMVLATPTFVSGMMLLLGIQIAENTALLYGISFLTTAVLAAIVINVVRQYLQSDEADEMVDEDVHFVQNAADAHHRIYYMMQKMNEYKMYRREMYKLIVLGDNDNLGHTEVIDTDIINGQWTNACFASKDTLLGVFKGMTGKEFDDLDEGNIYFLLNDLKSNEENYLLLGRQKGVTEIDRTEHQIWGYIEQY